MSNDFGPIFARLKSLMEPYEAQLNLNANNAENYVLIASRLGPNKKPLWFGGVQIKKNYVSFHLMPVYMYPDLLVDVSEGLRKRMQGKSCFNFKKEDETLFNELDDLIKRSFERFKAEVMS
jgi:hypothetical protein